MLESENMGVRQIRDVYVIADGSSVWSWIVVSEDADSFLISQGRGKHVGDQV